MLCRNYCREKCTELGKGFGVVLTETISKYLNTKQLYESPEQFCLQIHLKKLNFFPNSIPSLTYSYDVYAYVLQRTSNWDQPPPPPPHKQRCRVSTLYNVGVGGGGRDCQVFFQKLALFYESPKKLQIITNNSASL